MPEILYQGKFLRLCKRRGWEFAESQVATGVVGILAETAAGEFIFIEQNRSPVNGSVIELPGGLVGDDGTPEPAETAARRELLEETGWGGGTWRSLGNGATSPGMSSEMVEIFHVTGAEKVAEGGGVGGEQIQSYLVPTTEAHAWLEKMRSSGKTIDFRVFAAMWLARARGNF